MNIQYYLRWLNKDHFIKAIPAKFLWDSDCTQILKPYYLLY